MGPFSTFSQRADNRRPSSLFGYVKALLPTVFGADESDEEESGRPEEAVRGTGGQGTSAAESNGNGASRHASRHDEGAMSVSRRMVHAW